MVIPNTLHLSGWDCLLIVAVTLQATILAYIYDPRWKGFMLVLPIPFTIASLAVGHPIDATNILAMNLLLLFTHAVRILHYKLKWPIIASIGCSALTYVVAGTLLAKVVPSSDVAFWLAFCGTLLLALFVAQRFGPSDEPGYRTPLPLWIKLPAIMVVITALVLAKSLLQGFITAFPMVGLVAAYESRYSLRTVCRQIPPVMLASGALMTATRLTQATIGFLPALGVGWLVYLVALYPIMQYTGTVPFTRTGLAATEAA